MPQAPKASPPASSPPQKFSAIKKAACGAATTPSTHSSSPAAM